MKFLLSLTFFFTLPLSAQDKNPFDNWLFKFFEGESEMFGDILDPDGEELDQGAGKLVTTLDLKNKKSVSIGTVRYKSQDSKSKYVSTVTPKGKNTYSGVTVYSNGEKSTYTMTLLDGKKYKSIVKAPNGLSVIIEGTLKNKNTLESTELIKGPDGTLLWKSKTTYKRGKKPKKID